MTVFGATGPRGPLDGLRVVEIAGIGPAPFGVMMLADLGGDVVRIDRPGRHAGNPVDPERDFLNRGRRSIVLDLKNDDDLLVALDLIRDADVLVEGNRPGVAERLGVGPDECLALNPRLVYARMTGWGQDGRLSRSAGHDINYIARSGALHPMGARDVAPTMPLNLLGDFGGGGTLLAFGILAGVLAARATGRGDVIDVSILDGTVLLTTMLQVWRQSGQWVDERESNMLDGGAHFYGVYRTDDDRFLSIGAIEPQFYHQLLVGLGTDGEQDWLDAHTDTARWPAMKVRMAEMIARRTLAEWLVVFADLDACVAPVLTPQEAIDDDCNRERGVFVEADGTMQPAPAPRFGRQAVGHPGRHPLPGEHSEEIRAALRAGSAWRSEPEPTDAQEA